MLFLLFMENTIKGLWESNDKNSFAFTPTSECNSDNLVSLKQNYIHLYIYL